MKKLIMVTGVQGLKVVETFSIVYDVYDLEVLEGKETCFIEVSNGYDFYDLKSDFGIE